jgi:hypothetical protein
MEFFIKKKSNLPKISVDIVIDSRGGYNQSEIDFSNSTAYFSMYDINTKIFYIKDLPAEILYDEVRLKYMLTFGLNVKYTKKVMSFVGFFTLNFNNEKIILPISEEFPENKNSEKLYINIVDSISEPLMCCKPNRVIFTIGSGLTKHLLTP